MDRLQQQGFSSTGQKLVLRELIVACHIGVTAEERACAQRLAVTLEAAVEPAQPRADRIEEVVDYGALARRVRAVCKDTKVQLLETLGADLAAACFSELRIGHIRLRIEKLDRYQDMAGIGVELEFSRSVDAPATNADPG